MKRFQLDLDNVIIDLVITYCDDTHKIIKDIKLSDITEDKDFITVVVSRPDQRKVINRRFNMSHIKEYAFHFKERKNGDEVANRNEQNAN